MYKLSIKPSVNPASATRFTSVSIQIGLVVAPVPIGTIGIVFGPFAIKADFTFTFSEK